MVSTTCIKFLFLDVVDVIVVNNVDDTHIEGPRKVSTVEREIQIKHADARVVGNGYQTSEAMVAYQASRPENGYSRGRRTDLQYRNPPPPGEIHLAVNVAPLFRLFPELFL